MMSKLDQSHSIAKYSTGGNIFQVHWYSLFPKFQPLLQRTTTTTITKKQNKKKQKNNPV